MKNLKKISIITVFLVMIIIFIFQKVKYKNNKIITTNAGVSKYKIFVDVEESKLFLFEDDILIKEYICSGGKWSTPSPIGTWTIVSKDTWGEGFGGHWLGLNVPWGSFGIHGTETPESLGWASSHGCIRMDNNDVAEIYKTVPIGTKITIVDGPYGAFGKGFRYIKSGMYGSDVYEIQRKLKELGYYKNALNGKFDGATEKAICTYCIDEKIYVRQIIDPDLQEHMGFILVE